MHHQLIPFEQWAAAQSIDLAGTTLRCKLVAVWEKEDTTISGTLCDYYERSLGAVDVLKDGQILGSLDSSDALKKPALDGVNVAIAAEGNMPYLIQNLVKKGEPVPIATGPFEIEWSILHERVLAQEAFYDALFKKDPQAQKEAAFRKFRQSEAFAKKPCDIEFYTEIRQEYLDSSFVGGLTLGDYYNWFHRSGERLDSHGQLTEKARDEASYMLTAWSDSNRDSNVYWLTRNLEVHPRHEAVFTAFVDQFCEKGSLESAATDPLPSETLVARRPRP